MALDEAAYEAEKRIEQAGQLGEKALNLSGLGLTKIPSGIWRLKNLQILDVGFHYAGSKNNIDFIPDEISSFTKLQSLDLSGNNLTSLPETFGRLAHLRSLDLSGNHLADLPRSLIQLTKLKELYLAFNELTSLPKWISNLSRLELLDLYANKIQKLPEALGKISQLRTLILQNNELTILPDAVGQLNQLRLLQLSHNKLTALPESLCQLTGLRYLNLYRNQLVSLPECLEMLNKLIRLNISQNQLTDLPASIIQLDCFDKIEFMGNPFNVELSAAIHEGKHALKKYLHARASTQIKLHEAKLIVVGEGEVGKTCLIDALLGNPWREHATTHGIEVQQIMVTDPEDQKELILNAWDFGGQRVYRPTHQLFFSAPAVYLVVWKPREGPQQGFVKEWIQLVKRREPSAKIIVVATHGGPRQRQPDIDRQELWDLFGVDTIIDFYFVDSKPDEQGHRKGIEELKDSIARVAGTLPEVGRSVPKSFADARAALKSTGLPYLPFNKVLDICGTFKMDDETTRLFITISHHLGQLTYYEHDPALSHIVILRPDWLSTAISYILDDERTRAAHGLVKFSYLGQLWDDPSREPESRYPATLHPIFLRLMEIFDLSYRVADPTLRDNLDPLSLIGQLVPDNRPKNLHSAWPAIASTSDIQQTQICRIVDRQTGQTATAEGLFYQLIVRLHKYSIGRVNYKESVHWQRGLVLDDDYNGRALLEHKNNDVHITVHAPYPQRFLTMLTEEVKYLVEGFWEGLRCDVMVPCLNPIPCSGLLEIGKLIESKKRGRLEQPCPVCNEWLSIDRLLLNVPAAQPDATALILHEFAQVKTEVEKARLQLSEKISYHGEKIMGRFDRLDDRTRRTLSRVDKTYADLLQILTDEAKEGPRLFSLVPIDRSNFNPREWIRAKFRLVLWCEHSRMPLPELNEKNKKRGVYEIEVDRKWYSKAAPYLKLVMGTLSLVLPLSASTINFALSETTYKAIEEQLEFGKLVIDTIIEETRELDESTNRAIEQLIYSQKNDFETIIQKDKDFHNTKSTDNSIKFGRNDVISAQGATLRELHALLKAEDPGFGGLVRVMNKRNEFLWVHEKFASEY